MRPGDKAQGASARKTDKAKPAKPDQADRPSEKKEPTWIDPFAQ
ncbi:MAG: hypothetical protein NZ890_02300 [Myxococcota bacterium]|nr:hypothetical protein [Myxococcota bacterium]